MSQSVPSDAATTTAAAPSAPSAHARKPANSWCCERFVAKNWTTRFGLVPCDAGCMKSPMTAIELRDHVFGFNEGCHKLGIGCPMCKENKVVKYWNHIEGLPYKRVFVDGSSDYKKDGQKGLEFRGRVAEDRICQRCYERHEGIREPHGNVRKHVLDRVHQYVTGSEHNFEILLNKKIATLVPRTPDDPDGRAAYDAHAGECMDMLLRGPAVGIAVEVDLNCLETYDSNADTVKHVERMRSVATAFGPIPSPLVWLRFNPSVSTGKQRATADRVRFVKFRDRLPALEVAIERASRITGARADGRKRVVYFFYDKPRFCAEEERDSDFAISTVESLADAERLFEDELGGPDCRVAASVRSVPEEPSPSSSAPDIHIEDIDEDGAPEDGSAADRDDAEQAPAATQPGDATDNRLHMERLKRAFDETWSSKESMRKDHEAQVSKKQRMIVLSTASIAQRKRQIDRMQQEIERREQEHLQAMEKLRAEIRVHQERLSTCERQKVHIRKSIEEATVLFNANNERMAVKLKRAMQEFQESC